jgi:glycosyltransferase involved in cell wall biosynthesis
MRIVHVFRSPVGGLFRHVRDLARGQSALGHDVGIYCDSTTGGSGAEGLIAETLPYCSLGIIREPISKMPGFGDIATAVKVRKHARAVNADIIHGHGAKGGLYGRLAGKFSKIPSIYTPHGGSLHYDWHKFPGALFLATEKALGLAGSGFIFVCEFEKKLFAQKIGLAQRPATVVHNGLWPEEFKAPVLNNDATDLLFVGEMRKLKGVDVLLQALAELNRQRKVTLTLVGDGAELGEFEALAATLNLGSVVRFVGRHAIDAALQMGKIMILPSRNESFPYVVLETIAAGVPIIASDVGGISEVLPATMMCRADDVSDLAQKIGLYLDRQQEVHIAASHLAKQARDRFSVAQMASKVLDFYKLIQPC